MSSVKREQDGKVGILTLNDPASLNAMTPELLGDLARAIGEMGVERGIRALILTGEGRGFSGQDLKAFNSLGDNIYTGVMKHYWPAMQALRECQMPVVVAVNGVAAGGGSALRCPATSYLARARRASSSRLARSAWCPKSRLDLALFTAPDPGGSARLDLMLLNEPLSAERAKEWGLVREVVDNRKVARRGKSARRPPRRWPDAGAGRDTAAPRGERARELRRAVPPRDRAAVNHPRKRRRAGRPQGLRRSARPSSRDG